MPPPVVDILFGLHQFVAMPVIVNFGCNHDARPGHINIDGSPTVLLARYLPLPARFFGPTRTSFVKAVRALKIEYATAKNLAMEPHSVDGFYASHVLEHMPRAQCVTLLRKVRGWLRPGGVLRVVLPDLRLIAEEYLRGEYGADRFIERTDLASTNRNPFALSKHMWMYDADSFHAILEQLDYANIARSEFGRSRIRELAELDIPERQHESFYVEACGERS